MSTQKKVIPEQIHLINFNIESASLKSTFQMESEHVEEFSMEIDYNAGYNLDEQLVKSDFKVIVKASKEGKEVGSGAFDLTFLYEVENLNDLVELDKKTKKITVNGGLANALASITYSTTRGILMTRFQGTLLSKFTLPIIDPNHLLKKQ